MAFPEFLAANGIQFRGHSRHGEVRLCCPYCGDTRFRLGLNWVTNVGHCFNCGWKSRGAIQSVLRALKVHLRREDLRAMLPAKSDLETKANIGPVSLPEDYVSLASISREDGEPFTLALDYWLERGFTVAEASKYRIGASFCGRYAYRIIIPVFWKGSLKSFLARSFCGREPKYFNSPGTRMIWNLEKRVERIVLAEGVLKAIALARTFELLHCCAALGHSLSSEQLDQLEECGVESVFIWPDPDSSGLLGTLSMAEQIMSRGIEVEVPEEVPTMQADETTAASHRRTLTSCAPLSRELVQRYKYEALRRTA